MRARWAGVLLSVLVVAGCTGDGGAGSGSDLLIERRVGYAVVVDQLAGSIEIGFSPDRDASSGDAFDVSFSLWRVADGAWNEPPVTCLGRGQRVELGIADVQDASRPGLLFERVIWISCLDPADE